MLCMFLALRATANLGANSSGMNSSEGLDPPIPPRPPGGPGLTSDPRPFGYESLFTVFPWNYPMVIPWLHQEIGYPANFRVGSGAGIRDGTVTPKKTGETGEDIFFRHLLQVFLYVTPIPL